MTYYWDFLICCCHVIWCHTVRKFTTTEGIFLDNFFDDKQPISHQAGVIWAVYLSDVILGVEMLYQRQTLLYNTNIASKKVDFYCKMWYNFTV